MFMCLVLASELSNLGTSHLPTTLFDFDLKRVHSSIYLLIYSFSKQSLHGYYESDSIPSTRVAVVNKVNLVPSPPEETNLKINKSNKYCKVLEI